MLKSAHTATASRSACVGDAGRAHRVGVRRLELLRAERQLLEEDERRARAPGRSGAVRQSATTASQTSSPSAYDATAPWEPVQKRALVEQRRERREELALARRSSPTGRASTRSSASENGRPKSSGR